MGLILLVGGLCLMLGLALGYVLGAVMTQQAPVPEPITVPIAEVAAPMEVPVVVPPLAFVSPAPHVRVRYLDKQDNVLGEELVETRVRRHERRYQGALFQLIGIAPDGVYEYRYARSH